MKKMIKFIGKNTQIESSKEFASVLAVIDV